MRSKDNKEVEQVGAQGTGSAEQTGRDRSEQQNQLKDMGSEERENVAGEAGLERESISTLQDMGSLSGRDDNAGGSGDDMSSENTGEATDR